MKDWTAWVSIAGALVGVAIVGVALAAAGEPQMVWFWCDVIGIEVCR